MKKILLSILIISSISASAQDSTAFIASDGNISPTTTKKYASIPTTSGSNLQLTGDWTIEAWVKIIRTSTQIHLIETYTTSNTGGFALRLQSSNVRIYQIVNGSNNNTNIIGNTTLNTAVWYHIAATLNETTDELKVYVNGVLDGTTTCTLNTFNNNNSLNIGARGDDANVNGEVAIDEVRIWNFAKTQAQIQANMTTCLTGSETDLLAWYDFEGTPTSTIVDQSVNGNDGTFINFDPLNFDYGAYSCGSSTGVNENEPNTQIMVFPNPSSLQVNINSSETIEKINIMDLTGKTIRTIVKTYNSIDVSSLAKGMYFLQIHTEKGISTKQLIKE